MLNPQEAQVAALFPIFHSFLIDRGSVSKDKGWGLDYPNGPNDNSFDRLCEILKSINLGGLYRCTFDQSCGDCVLMDRIVAMMKQTPIQMLRITPNGGELMGPSQISFRLFESRQTFHIWLRQ